MVFVRLTPRAITGRRLGAQSLIPIVPIVLAALAFSFGTEAALAAVASQRAQSGMEVGVLCVQLGYGDEGNESNFNDCATGGCRTLHGSADVSGMAACMAKTQKTLALWKEYGEFGAADFPVDGPLTA